MGLRGLRYKLTVSHCSLRVGRGVCRGETPALLRQSLSKHLLSMCTAFAMKQQDPDSREQGESEVSLPTAPHGWQRGCQGSLHPAKLGQLGVDRARALGDASLSPAEVLIPSGICSLPSSMHAVSPGRG